MIALARARRAFHFSQESIHLVDAHDAASADRSVAGHGGEDEVDLFAEQQRFAVLDQIVVDIAQQLFGIALLQRMGDRAHQHGRGAEAFDHEAVARKTVSGIFEPVAGGLVQFDHVGHQQRLAARNGIFRTRGPQALQHQALVRGMLIDEDTWVVREVGPNELWGHRGATMDEIEVEGGRA